MHSSCPARQNHLRNNGIKIDHLFITSHLTNVAGDPGALDLLPEPVLHHDPLVPGLQHDPAPHAAAAGLTEVVLPHAALLHLHPDTERVLGHRVLLLGVTDPDHGLADDGAGAC